MNPADLRGIIEARPGPHQNPWPGKPTTAKDLADSLEQLAKVEKQTASLRWDQKTIDLVANIAWAIKKDDKPKVEKLLSMLVKDGNVSQGLVNEIQHWLAGQIESIEEGSSAALGMALKAQRASEKEAAEMIGAAFKKVAKLYADLLSGMSGKTWKVSKVSSDIFSLDGPGPRDKVDIYWEHDLLSGTTDPAKSEFTITVEGPIGVRPRSFAKQTPADIVASGRHKSMELLWWLADALKEWAEELLQPVLEGLMERVTGPTRMQVQQAVDRERKTGKSVQQAIMAAEKAMGVKDIKVNSSGDVVWFEHVEKGTAMSEDINSLRDLVEGKPKGPVKQGRGYWSREEKKGELKKKERRSERKEIAQQMKGESVELAEGVMKAGQAKKLVQSLGLEAKWGGRGGSEWNAEFADEKDYQKFGKAARKAGFQFSAFKTGYGAWVVSSEVRSGPSPQMIDQLGPAAYDEQFSQAIRLLDLIAEDYSGNQDILTEADGAEGKFHAALVSVVSNTESLAKKSREFADYAKDALKTKQVDVSRLGRYGREVEKTYKDLKDAFVAMARSVHEEVEAAEAEMALEWGEHGYKPPKGTWAAEFDVEQERAQAMAMQHASMMASMPYGGTRPRKPAKAPAKKKEPMTVGDVAAKAGMIGGKLKKGWKMVFGTPREVGPRPAYAAAEDITAADLRALIEAKGESTAMVCNECGKKFKKRIGPSTVEVQCPKCKGYDTEPEPMSYSSGRRFEGVETAFYIAEGEDIILMTRALDESLTSKGYIDLTRVDGMSERASINDVLEILGKEAGRAMANTLDPVYILDPYLTLKDKTDRESFERGIKQGFSDPFELEQVRSPTTGKPGWRLTFSGKQKSTTVPGGSQRDVQVAFQKLKVALTKTKLPTSTGEDRTASVDEFMLMQIRKDGTADFKHCVTRNYVFLAPSGKLIVPKDKNKPFSHGEFDTDLSNMIAREKASRGAKASGLKTEAVKKYREGDTVRVPHKGKMVKGKVVRFEPGSMQDPPSYVVDVGEYASIEVPLHNVEAI